jgi:predicted  nucleic acid-binding Zn-ribbon protein
MPRPGFRLRYLVFHGPGRVAAGVEFGPGLNVVYGASETGKSFVVESIDFMLGGKPPLRDIPQRAGYDRVLLGIETIEGEQFTLLRSADGGGFRLYDGLHREPPSESIPSRELADHHNEKSPNNLSSFLLEKCGLVGQRIRRNKLGDTNSLSFRNLARLLIVTETEIIEQRSPLTDGNPTADTSNFATFKLLLTGVDDGALTVTRPAGSEDQSREAQLVLLDQLLSDYRDRVKEITNNPKELEEQLARLERSLAEQEETLNQTEAGYRQLVSQRRDLRQKIEMARERRSEISGMLSRFALLDEHYVSDISRLRGIEEGGTLFAVLGQSPCPLCGAEPSHQNTNGDCDGNVGAVVAGARSEARKIELLRKELSETVANLKREGAGFGKRLPKVEQELESVSAQIDRLVAPRLAQLRTSYAGLADKRGEVREALAVFTTIQDLEKRRAAIEAGDGDQQNSSVAEGDLQMIVAENFARTVESILMEWHFPDPERVYFDSKLRDLVIAGKPRTARGKGLRAITHAAFTIGLMQYCKLNETPHPGFVVLDSPLLAYRAPEGTEDDLSGTDLDEKFYGYLEALPADRQAIIIENIDPPTAIANRPQVVMFSNNPHSGRQGFFPAVPTNRLF